MIAVAVEVAVADRDKGEEIGVDPPRHLYLE